MEGFLLDLHIHTAESSYCGKVPAWEMVRAYRDAGFHGVAVTDHYSAYFFDKIKELPWAEQVERYMRGYEEAAAEAAGTDFKVYFGLEYRDRITVDDFLVYGVDKAFLLSNPDLHDIPLKEAAARIHAYGGVILQAHPARLIYGMAMGDKVFTGFRQANINAHIASDDRIPVIDWSERDTLIGKPAQLTCLRMCHLREADSLDGIEIYNGNHTWAQNAADVALYRAQHPEYACIAASDFHSYPNGTGGTYFSRLPESDAELVQLLKAHEITGYRTSYGIEV